MKIKMTWKVIDDMNQECDVNDIITIQAHIPRYLTMDEPSQAIIKEIQATNITVRFFDPMYGNVPVTLRQTEIDSLVFVRHS